MPSEEHHCSSPAGSEQAASGAETSLTDTQHGYMSPIALIRPKLQAGLGSPSKQGKSWHMRPRTGSPVTPEQALPCSPGAALYITKLLTFQHLFRSHTKASQGPVRPCNISVDISVPERAALLWLCVSQLWLCQKTVQSLVAQANPSAWRKGSRRTDRRWQLEKGDLGSLHTISPFVVYPRLPHTAWL